VFLKYLLLLVAFSCVLSVATSEIITVYERCGYTCSQGRCMISNLTLNTCMRACSACTRTCSNQSYYFLTQITKTNYTVKIYTNENCTPTSPPKTYSVICDRCQARDGCFQGWYLNCGWSWLQVSFVLGGAACIVLFVGVIIFFVVRKPKPKMTAFTVDAMEIMTPLPVQDSHSSIFYGGSSSFGSSVQNNYGSGVQKKSYY